MHRVAANGASIPALGLGTWTLKGEACAEIVDHALKTGYRHLDTAAMYGNEDAVGAGAGKALGHELGLRGIENARAHHFRIATDRASHRDSP